MEGANLDEMYNPAMKNIEKVEKINGKFVSNKIMTIEEANKKRKFEQLRLIEERNKNKYSKFNVNYTENVN